MNNEIVQKSAQAVADAYTKILNQEVSPVSLGDVRVSKTSFKDFLEQFGQKSEETIALVYFIVYQMDPVMSVAGQALIVFEVEDKAQLQENARSRLAEVGNILIGKYLGSLSDLTGQNLRVSIQPIFKTSANEAAKILENQLFRGNINEELSLTEINLLNKPRREDLRDDLQSKSLSAESSQIFTTGKSQTSLYVFLKI